MMLQPPLEEKYPTFEAFVDVVQEHVKSKDYAIVNGVSLHYGLPLWSSFSSSSWLVVPNQPPEFG